MKISITKALALGGLCALFAGAAGMASAQGDDATGMHQDHMAMHQGHMAAHHPRRHIKRLQAAYARDVASGHRGAAERAHLKAHAIRQRVRAHREMTHDGMDHHDMAHHDMPQ